MQKSFQRFEGSRIFSRSDAPIMVRREGSQKDYYAHDHDFIEIVLTIGGTALQKTARYQRPLKRGSLTVLRPGHWHEYLDCRRFKIYNCCFGPGLLRHELAWLVHDPILARLLWGTGRQQKEAEPFVSQLPASALRELETLLDAFPQGDSATNGIKISQLSLFLNVLSRELRPFSPPTESKTPPAVLRCLQKIEQDLALPWTVLTLARECGCSPEYLIRLFKQSIGLAPYAYISRCRAERAASLLGQSDIPVAEIGTQVGWAEPCHFARRFKHFYGVSARQYRNRTRHASSLKKDLP